MLTVLLFVGLMVGAFVALFIIIITLFIGAVVVVPVSLLALAWITTALLHAPLVIITERRTAFSAVARSFQLNRGLWWRNMGAVSLLLVMVLIIISIAAVPLGIASGVASAADQGQAPMRAPPCG
ncbi:hypothetical protein [Nesterenkonia pannonica]|uniref:hypothetical protein n=1 Tax=Nesterenkonia pannonica TaxID=1548602 RepID=UPI00216438EA|nr:hypothetical protein [Nesterenkonia pannonica]